jgi:hypothetical protein
MASILSFSQRKRREEERARREKDQGQWGTKAEMICRPIFFAWNSSYLLH